MPFLCGFDPGGAGRSGQPDRFGWCIATFSASLPLSIVLTGLARNAEQAVGDAVANIPERQALLAVGIDSPLLWTVNPGRIVDQMVREAIQARGAPHPEGTVQHVNSLKGACVVQGIQAGVLIRRAF